MKSLIQANLRIYIIIGLLAIAGVWSGMNMSVSLFPNSAKPIVRMYIGYGGLSASSFIKSYGEDFENQLQKISRSGNEVIKIKGDYRKRSVFYTVYFDWGVEHDAARSEVEAVASSFKARLPQESADNMNIWQWNSNTGFYALSFYSSNMTTNELYRKIEPKLSPLLAKIKDADNPSLWNPNRMDVKIILDPHKMAKLNIYPRDIISSVLKNHKSYTGGVVKEGENNLSIQIDNSSDEYNSLGQILIRSGTKSVYLSQISSIEYSSSKNHSRLFKTNGAPSLILFSKPKGDGNVKRMSEEINQAVEKVIGNDENIKYKTLVDPASFISSAVKNVFHEVGIAAFLAVLVLFLFIGNLKNVITIGLEIPLSIVVSFIFMKIFGVNLNLISLGGLALAAGMNVDASIVVLENIFRHLKREVKLNPSANKLNIISRSVKEVAAPIFVSMITTLIVFIPIAFTSELTNAILGDLAKAVIFSHCFSAFVAVFMVPSIRYQIIKNQKNFDFKSPISNIIEKFESTYINLLHSFMLSKKKRLVLFSLVTTVLVFLLTIIMPNIPKEMIGKPSTDWVEVFVRMHSSQHMTEMEEKALKIEDQILTQHGKKIRYTFVQIHNKNQASLMFRLKNKNDSEKLIKIFEKKYKNSPDTYYKVTKWNPASVPIPDPEDLNIKIESTSQQKMQEVAEKIIHISNENSIYNRIWTEPSIDRVDSLKLEPYQVIWNELNAKGIRLQKQDLIDLTQVAQGSKKVTDINVNDDESSLYLTFGDKYINSVEELKSFPLNVAGRIVPLNALADVRREESEKRLYREDSTPMILINARKDQGDDNDYLLLNKKLTNKIKTSKLLSSNEKSMISFIDSKIELNESLQQLIYALIISLLLVFIVLTMQFQNFLSPLVIMMAIPLGVIGVISSLFIFDSYISLNSALGVILLNGIAVNNSILLIDFSNKLFDEGIDAYNSIIDSARKRFRPILITSLTTILGMAPIAFGFGEGGKVLQPLGIAVSGGLGVSTFLTLLIIPTLQYMVLKKRMPRNRGLDENVNEEKILSSTPLNNEQIDKGESLQ